MLETQRKKTGAGSCGCIARPSSCPAAAPPHLPRRLASAGGGKPNSRVVAPPPPSDLTPSGWHSHSRPCIASARLGGCTICGRGGGGKQGRVSCSADNTTRGWAARGGAAAPQQAKQCRGCSKGPPKRLHLVRFGGAARALARLLHVAAPLRHEGLQGGCRRGTADAAQLTGRQMCRAAAGCASGQAASPPSQPCPGQKHRESNQSCSRYASKGRTAGTRR